MISQSPSGNRSGIIWTASMTLTMMLCLLAIGCGGGGGDGGGVGPAGIAYSGLTTPAEITQDNANSISSGAFESGTSAQGIAGIASMTDPDRPPQDGSRPFLYDVANLVKESVQQIHFGSAPDNNVRTANKTVEVNGDCGGKTIVNGNYTQGSGDFSGTVSYKNFCENGAAITGEATFQGSINTSTNALTSFTIKFTTLSGTSGSESYTMSGQISFGQSGGSFYVTMDMLIKDNNKPDYVCRIDKFKMDITEGARSSQMTVSGRFFDPEYGYVDLETESALVIDNGAENPKSGVIILKGKAGSAGGPTKAKLTALSSAQCQVEADTNGDDTYDYDSGPKPWSKLESSES